MFRLLVSVILVVYLSPAVKCSIQATKTATNVGGLAKELALLGVFGSERAIIVRNRANDGIRVWCSSRDDSTGEQRINPGENIGFNFKPHVVGSSTLFWCTVDYKGYWARWDAFGGDDDYFTNNRYDKAYEYEVRNDGVYIKGGKIRGLDAGHNRYVLWEHYDNNKNPFGGSLTGHVDNGMCNNLPNWMERKTSAATVCNGQCIILYEQLHCRGYTSTLRSSGGGCSNFWLSYFNDKAKSVKGC